MADFNKGYNGNPFLKQVGEEIEFTPEQAQEYEKCYNSVEYFLENYAKIVSLDDGIVNFKPFEYQKRILNSLKDHRKVLVKLFRQSGKCVFSEAKYKVRDKKSGQILELTAKEFHDLTNPSKPT